MTFSESGPLFAVLNELEANIALVLNASLPNKQQHSAALKMSSRYFAEAYDAIQSLLENQ